MSASEVNAAIDVLNESRYSYEILHDKLISFISRDPVLKKCVHSYKSRFKDLDHLAEKIFRKNEADELLPEGQRKGEINEDNVQERITDFCGIRVLHLYMGQFESIHKKIMSFVDDGEIALYESPKAYTWDPEYSAYFENLGLESHVKESFYTSVHYVIKPRKDSDITCELQVRTLFEEVWGEIDHTVNYPRPTDSIAVKEQLKVLARLVGAGTRLADSVFKLSQ